jgi:hypothetical protein
MDSVHRLMSKIMTKNKRVCFGHRIFLHSQLKSTGKPTQLGLTGKSVSPCVPEVQMDKVHCVENPTCDIPWSELYVYNCTASYVVAL